MFFDARCPICTRRGAAPCAACVRSLRLPPALPVPDGLDGFWALTAYDEVGRGLVTALKFRNDRAVVAYLGDALAEAACRRAVDVVTWAPTTARRRRARGYDQAELLARAAARRAGLPVARTLVRLPGPHQTGRPVDERLDGPRFVAGPRAVSRCRSRRIAIVDDVVTTGSTLSHAARALRSAEAREVVGLAVARTPRPAR